MSSQEKRREQEVGEDFAAQVLRAASPQSLTDYLKQRIAKVPNFHPPAVSQGDLCPVPPSCSEEQMNEYRSAAVFLRSLAAEALAWRKELPPDYRPAILALVYGGIQIHVRSLAQVSFDGIRIEGTLEGRPCSLLAHQSTVQMLCYAEEVSEEEPEPHNPIGFIWPDHSTEV